MTTGGNAPAAADVGSRVRAFYEENSFPGYEEYEAIGDLVAKARGGWYARRLDDEIPIGVRILDAGCGTGQLGIFLSLTRRTVVSVDFSYNSLRKGQEFKRREGVSDVHFVQMDLFHSCLRPDVFDFVFSNGVLHHTADAFAAFCDLCRVLKPGGFMAVGLYNRYGRLLLDARRTVFRLSRDRFRWLDYFMRSDRLGDRKKRIWFLDQYRNPHESTFSVADVLGWFARCGIQYVNSVPQINPAVGDGLDDLFAPRPAGGPGTHLMTQLGWILTQGREGGFFVMIGRKGRGTA